MRAKRFALFALLIAVFIVVVLLIPKLIYRHPYVNTAGLIVFASDRGSPGQSHLFLARPDGSDTRQLTTGAHNDTQPSFSSDGTQITFVSDRTGSPEVYVMNADGDEARAISIGTDQKLTPQFSSNNQSVAYISRGQLIVADVIGGHTSIALPTTQNVSATNTQTLSSAVRAPVVSFAWSPSTDSADSQKIAAVQQLPDSDVQTVTLVDLGSATAAPKVLTGASLASASWSPDGKQLAAGLLGVSGPNGQTMNISGIAEFDDNGTALYSTPIAAAPSRAAGPQSPTFSPSGTKIMFTITRLTTLNTPVSTGLAIADDQPGGKVQVVLRGPANTPQIAKTGKSILFLAPTAPNSPQQAVFVADTATGKITHLTTPAENATSAQWSPAGGRGK